MEVQFSWYYIKSFFLYRALSFGCCVGQLIYFINGKNVSVTTHFCFSSSVNTNALCNYYYVFIKLSLLLIASYPFMWAFECPLMNINIRILHRFTSNPFLASVNYLKYFKILDINFNEILSSSKYFLIFGFKMYFCSSGTFFQFHWFNKRILKQNTALYLGCFLPIFYHPIDRCNI
jgi:hypothetical protein